MDITPLVGAGKKIIQSYTPGQFRINGEIHAGPIIVFTDSVHEWTTNASAETLGADDFQSVIERTDELDLLLLGCGEKMELPLFKLRSTLKEQNIILEIMDTGAACRTYNVLMAEGRRVAAALLPV